VHCADGDWVSAGSCGGTPAPLTLGISNTTASTYYGVLAATDACGSSGVFDLSANITQ
jgi:hypothetical protein